MRAAFTGHQPLIFTDYIDLGTGRALTAEPGGVYDIAPASGRNVPEVPGQWFTPVDDDPADDAEPEAPAGDAGDPEGDED